MSFDKVMTAPFRDNGIIKILIGGLICLIPVIDFFALGYAVKCCANVINGNEELPEWDNWGEKFKDGLLMIIITIVYMLIPGLIISAIIGSTVNSFLPVSSADWMAINVACLAIGLVFSFIMPMVFAHYAANKKFGSAFQVGKILKLILAAFGSYIGAFFLYLLACILCLLICLIPVIGWLLLLFVVFFLSCVGGFLFGSVYKKAVAVTGGYVPAYSPPAITLAATGGKYCSNCGAKLTAGDIFCSNCGNKYP